MYEVIKDNKNLCVQYDLDYIVDHLLCNYEVSLDTLQQYVDYGKKWKTFYKQVITALNKSNSQKAYINEKTKDYYIRSPKDDLLVYLLNTPYEVTYA